MKTFIVLLLTAFNFVFSQNNSLYIPLDLQKAFENETRSFDGKPGKNYWQNKSDYNINAEVLTDSSILIGEEEIKYYNNSPDTLKMLVIRLYQDIAKKGAVRDWYVGDRGFTDGVVIKELIIDHDTINVIENTEKVRSGSTNLFVRLNKSIIPNSTSNIKVKWQFEIPQELKIRMGNYGKGNMFISYWYPQIAVYDDIDGWDVLDYSGSVEFYNDFSNYEFEIKVPNGFLVWATGEIQNAKDVLHPNIYDRFIKAQNSDETVKIVTPEDYKNNQVTKANLLNEWKFKANNVTDVSFAISKSYNWDGASLIVDDKTGRRSLTDVVYPDSTIHYDQAAQYARATIEYLSKEIPGYPFPYSHVTTFCNGARGGGMETPMMANNGAPLNKASHIGLVFHEIAHNYFPFIMGTNERKYAWMDEGWATFLPKEVVERYEPESYYLKRNISSFDKEVGHEAELPLIVPSYSNSTKFARTAAYTRPSIAYNQLMNLLGRDLFKKSLLEYMNRWNGKHPIPTDFFFTFNEVTGEDLSWFWKPWFYEFGYPDLKLTDVKFRNGVAKILIDKLGNIPTSVEITIEFKDGSKETISKSATLWKESNSAEIKFETYKEIKTITLGSPYIPDVDRSNNTFEFN